MRRLLLALCLTPTLALAQEDPEFIPYDEPSYHHLIAALHRARRHGEARRAYRAYAGRMQEIGTPAEPLETLLGPRG